MTHDEMIAVVKAHKEGKSIEVYLQDKGLWVTCPQADLPNFASYTYRIKPAAACYRRYLCIDTYGGGVYVHCLNRGDYTKPEDLETQSQFVRWIDTSWQEARYAPTTDGASA